jgi:hypothetical protein
MNHPFCLSGLRLTVASVGVWFRVFLPTCVAPIVQVVEKATLWSAIWRWLVDFVSGASDCTVAYEAATAATTAICCAARFVAHLQGLKPKGKDWHIWFVEKIERDDR